MQIECLGCNSLQVLQQQSYVDHLHISMHPCQARKALSALFATSAACDHMRDWVLGTPKVDYLSSQITFDHAEFICFHILLLLFLIILIFCKFSFGFVIQGTWVSMGVYSDVSYGIPKDIIYSFQIGRASCRERVSVKV